MLDQRAHERHFSVGTSFTLAIEHTSAYISAITDMTLGVSG